jgi:hypothetical protein
MESNKLYPTPCFGRANRQLYLVTSLPNSSETYFGDPPDSHDDRVASIGNILL